MQSIIETIRGFNHFMHATVSFCYEHGAANIVTMTLV